MYASLKTVVVGGKLAGVARPGHHGTTFGGNPLACGLGAALLEEIEEKRLLDRVEKVGRRLGAALASLARRQPKIRAVRGLGLMWGIELDRPAAPVARRLLELGFVVGTARENVIRLLPPYIVPASALTAFARAFETVLSEEIRA